MNCLYNSSCYLYCFSLSLLSPPFPPIFLSAPLKFPRSAHFPAMATSSTKGNTAPLEGTLKGKDIAADEGSLGLDSVRPGFSGTLEVLIYRICDVHNTNGRYRATEYIVSDQHGNAVLCSVCGNISHCFVSKLEEGRAFSLKNFSVVPNKEKFRVRNSDKYIIELEGFTVVKKIEGPVDAYTHFPFQLVPLEDIILNDSTYLIEEQGCESHSGAPYALNSLRGGKNKVAGHTLPSFRLCTLRNFAVKCSIYSNSSFLTS